MATNFPSSLDDSTTIPVESANTKLSTNHVTAHQNIQDAIEAIEAKVGVNSSAVTTSHDYKLSEVTSTDKAVGKTATQTVSNKTFTSSTYNGVTLTTGGSATDVLNAQGNYINGSITDASTTVKGVVEEATSSELAAGTAAGGTSARLFVNPSTLMPNGKIDRSYIKASFGGSGADGALSISSGTTTIDLGNAAVFTKNYTSISITGTGNLAFTNPNTNGTIIRLKSQGGVTITSSSSSVIDLRNLGAAGGAAGTNGSTGFGGGGAGGSAIGGSGSNGSAAGASDGTVGSDGTAAKGIILTGSGGAGGKLTGTATGGSISLIGGLPSVNVKNFPITPGSGGGGGAGGNSFSSSSPGAGGRGAGALLIECGGALNFTTGTINAAGTAGANGTGSFGAGGGGGGGGTVLILYNSLTANSGTISTTGGSGGTSSSSAGGAGANGSSLVAENTEFT